VLATLRRRRGEKRWLHPIAERQVSGSPAHLMEHAFLAEVVVAVRSAAGRVWPDASRQIPGESTSSETTGPSKEMRYTIAHNNADRKRTHQPLAMGWYPPLARKDSTGEFLLLLRTYSACRVAPLRSGSTDMSQTLSSHSGT
jgi:hypothetical protein